MSVSNPPRPKTYNGYLTASGWGTLYVRVMTIGHGMSVISSGTAYSRGGRELYLTRRTSGSFGATFLCTSFQEYRDFGTWIKEYGQRLAVDAPTVGPVRVVCPSRNFDKVAVPNGITFGDRVDAVTYPISINFMGSRDPVSMTNEFLSEYRDPEGSDDPSLPYYYPGGTQLSGTAKGVDSLFDVPPKIASDLGSSPFYQEPRRTPQGAMRVV